MANASDVQDSFLGGEWSPLSQGAVTDPAYRQAMNVCLNTIPIEQGAAVRRSGTLDASTTRGGVIGRVIQYDFAELTPYTMEFTDGHLRFRTGTQLVTTNDSTAVSSISAATPAEVTLASAPSNTWSTGDQGFFSGLGTNAPLLQGRLFSITVIDDEHFTIADALTGASIVGSAIGSIGFNAVFSRVLDIVTPYLNGAWAAPTMRFIQTETTGFLLNSATPPYQVTVTQVPIGNNFAQFSLDQSFFEDGPYLDPIPGSIASASAVEGIVTVSITVQAYDSSTAYTKGDFALSSSVAYESLQDANVGNTPASSPTFWKVVSAGAPINNGQGFVASDIGRLIRLFSEPAAWASGTTYGQGAVVSYNPSGLPGQNTYWQSLQNSNTGNVPGTDVTHWQIIPIGVGATVSSIAGSVTLSTGSPAIWTWGKITGLAATGAIPGSTGTAIGNLTDKGGLTAAFDGVTSKKQVTCAAKQATTGSDWYVGKNYTGGAQAISQAVVYPSTDFAFANFFDNILVASVTLNLRASNSAPSSASNGTLLGTSGNIQNVVSAPITILSDDAVSTWNYVWIELTYVNDGIQGAAQIAQVIFYNASAAPGTAVSVEILGPPLIYSATPITTWQLGVYSDTTGWPTCGTFIEGRLWLAGAIPNRVDACVANGIAGVTNGQTIGSVNFAPTDQYNNVLDSSGISAIFNAPGANPIFWLSPDQQGVLAGTQAGEWLIYAPTAGGFAPNNIAARQVTRIGCANIEPTRCEHTLAFVQRYQRNVMEYFPDVFSGKFTAPNLSKRARHLTVNGVQEIGFQREKTPIIWAYCGDGSLIGATYKRDTLMTSSGPTFIGWHRHTLGSGRQVVSLTVGPSSGGNLDAPQFVTFDPVSGLYYVEILSDIFDEDSTELTDAQFLDGAIVPSYMVGSSSCVFSGLWNLIGRTVTVWAGGLDCGDYTVSASGTVTVPYGDGISAPGGTVNDNSYGQFTGGFVGNFNGAMPVFIGFTYTSQGQRLRPVSPADTGARIGPGFAKLRRGHQFGVQVFNTAAGAPNVGTISFGTTFTRMHPALFVSPGKRPLGVGAFFNGIFWNTLDDDYSFDSMECWQVTRPYPAQIVALGGFRATQDT